MICGSVGGESSPSMLYQRPYTPSIDYTPSVDYSDDAQSGGFQSMSPSEFSVDVFRKSPKKQAQGSDGEADAEAEGEATPETMATSESSEEADSSPSGDSGVADLNVPVLEREELGAHRGDVVRELTTVTHLRVDFLGDVREERVASRELVDELHTKVRPFLIGLDEELSQLEQLLRHNVDRARISETRVCWLLLYTRFTQQSRHVLTALSTDIFDQLEQLLRLRDRGCQNLPVQPTMAAQLKGMLKTLLNVEEAIRSERATPEAAYA